MAANDQNWNWATICDEKECVEVWLGFDLIDDVVSIILNHDPLSAIHVSSDWLSFSCGGQSGQGPQKPIGVGDLECMYALRDRRKEKIVPSRLIRDSAMRVSSSALCNVICA